MPEPSHCLLKRLEASKPRAPHPLQELSFRGGYYGISFWAEIFQDHSGMDLWLPLAQGCLEELRGLTSAADQYLEAHGKNRCMRPSLPATHSSGTQSSAYTPICEPSCLHDVRLGYVLQEGSNDPMEHSVVPDADGLEPQGPGVPGAGTARGGARCSPHAVHLGSQDPHRRRSRQLHA